MARGILSIMVDMTRKQELELAYLRAMNEWMAEEHNTKMMAMQPNAVGGFSAQLAKEKAAFERYKAVQAAFVAEPFD